MRPKTRLQFERLEDRSLPAIFGTPWPDGSNITLSFVPDGTDIAGTSSNLTAAILGTTSGSAARQDILRAFQSWVANANINVGLTSDSGDAYNASGAVQGDSRFGDIRVGGRTWAGDVGALTAAFNYFNTESGNIAINTAKSFGYGATSGDYNLFTVMLQETGHSLGIGNSTNINSVMYEIYQGTRTGLSSGDVASIQSLYGARQQDALEGMLGNNSLITATTYGGTLTADLTTTGDVDYFRFTVGTSGVTPVIRLQAAGLSLVQARVQVLNSLGLVVADGAAQNSTSNDVTLTVPDLMPGGTYYVRVSSNTSDVFGVGSYRLTIDGSTATGGSSGGSSTQTVTGDHTSFASAAVLTQQITSVDDRLDYAANVTPSTQSDLTYLRIHSPAAQMGQPLNFVVTVTNMTVSQDMQVKVYDANHIKVDLSVLTDTNGATVVQVNNAQANVDYFVRVNSAASFKLGIDFTTRDTAFTMGSLGGPSAGATQNANLYVAQSQVVHFVLSSAGDNNASIQMKITDGSGNTVYLLSASGGKSRSSEVFLAAGTYHVEMSLVTSPNYFGGSLTYSLYAWGVTDPVGASPTDPSGSPTGGSGGGGTPPPGTNGATVYWTGTSPSDGSLWL